jgi:aminomethyltransferase
LKKTPLYDRHAVLGGKIIDFGGWSLPVQYTSIIEEHNTVREKAGLFDVSHMGEILVSGRDAQGFIQYMVTNDISKMQSGRVMYSPVCYPTGGVVDDILIYKKGDEEYLLVVNAANTDKDFEWFISNKKGQVDIINKSNEYAQLALQGPNAQSILQNVVDIDLNDLKFFRFLENVNICGINALISRTGYTGEDGFELYISPNDAVYVWDMLLEKGEGYGLKPIGLGARDTLRFEAALPLYGQEISEDISPLEGGLGYFVKLKKDSFVGKDALLQQKQEGVLRRLIGFEMVGRGLARSHYKIEIDEVELGFVTSGNFSPTLNKNLGMAIIDEKYAVEGQKICVIVRNKPIEAKIIEIPFYKKQYKK